MKRTVLARESSKSSDSWTRPGSTRRHGHIRFVLCLADSEPDLLARKIYQTLPDEVAARDRYVRVIDESGEDYLYPEEYFIHIELPERAKSLLSRKASKTG